MKALYIIIAVLILAGQPLAAQVDGGNQTTVNNPGTPTITISPDREADRTKVERNTAAFDPAYFANKENRHLLLEVRIDSTGKLVPVRMTNAVGKMPYRNRTGGPVKVTVKTANNEVIDSYYFEDPTALRSCDNGGARSAAKAGSRAWIPLPKAANIGKVEFAGTVVGKGEIVLDVESLVRRIKD